MTETNSTTTPMPAVNGEDEQYKKLLNASGFAFQLALEEAAKRAPGRYGWKVVATEHACLTRSGTQYIDLVISNGRIYLVIEAKRTRDATWVFLLPDEKQLSRSHARIHWTDTAHQSPPLAGWGDIQVYPHSPEVAFCAVRGQGERDAPMLERIAASVAELSEGLAAHLLELNEKKNTTHVIVPVIVTNAKLVLARFKPQEISLTTGNVDEAAFDIVPHVRFRKSLAAAESPAEYEPEQLQDLSWAAERTVFVVNSDHFTDWLNEFQINTSSAPWTSAREMAGG